MGWSKPPLEEESPPKSLTLSLLIIADFVYPPLVYPKSLEHPRIGDHIFFPRFLNHQLVVFISHLCYKMHKNAAIQLILSLLQDGIRELVALVTSKCFSLLFLFFISSHPHEITNIFLFLLDCTIVAFILSHDLWCAEFSLN